MARSGGSGYGNDRGGTSESLAAATAAAAAAAKTNGKPGARAEVRALARALLSPEYFESLKLRLLAGVAAPAVEVAVWRYAFGEPGEAADDSAATQQEVFEEMRIRVRRTLRSKGARALDAKVQGGRRLLGPDPYARPVEAELLPIPAEAEADV